MTSGTISTRQKAPDDIEWKINKCELNEKKAINTEPAPGPDGIPYRICSCG